jgi:DNA polymerase-1
MAQRLLLLDASSTIYRAFFALPALSNRAGVPTNATLGFVNTLQKLLRERKPDYVAVVWDAPGPKRRKALYADYKATREATPEDLGAQIPYIRRIVAAYRLASLEEPGEEADDVIAALALQAAAQGIEVEIASTDKDLMQLASEHIALLDAVKDRRYGPAEVEARFGVPPQKLLDLRALVGDSSDNIPGVKGIGEKGAAQLMAEYGSLDAILEHAGEVKQKRAREALLAGRELALLSRELSRLRTDLPVEFSRDAMRVPEPDRAALAQLFEELGFKRQLEELGAQRDKPGLPDEVAVRVAAAREVGELASHLASSPALALRCVIEPDDAMTGELVGLALAAGASEAQFVDLRGGDAADTLAALAPLFAAPDRVWRGHRLKRDAVALGRRGIELAGTLCDAGVAAYVVDPSQPVERADALRASYLDRPSPSQEDRFGKGARRRSLSEVAAEELSGFFGAEVALTHPLQAAIEARLEATGQLDLYRELEVPLTSVLARMELAGVRIDEVLLERLSKRLASELERCEARIYALAGEPFNIGSPKQLQTVLFEKLALPPTKKTKTGFSTDESVLEELAQSYELPAEILAHRRLSKLKSTYVDALPALVHPETGRIHGRFNQTVAATGRLSSSNPNLQNIPVRTPEGQEIRRAFIPAEGRVLLSADYSQIELRILAHVSRDPGLVQAFREGVDIHVRTASQVFGVPPDQVSGEQRSRTKAINFGIIYGQGAFGLARQLGISQADARAYIQQYFEQYPGVKAFLDESKRIAREQGFAATLAGRRRYLPDLRSRNRVLREAAERMATNSVIQGTAADIIKRAMVRIDAALRRKGAPQARMILQVHDELVFEVAPVDLAEVAELVAREMREVAELSVPVEVHVGSGKTWLDAH